MPCLNWGADTRGLGMSRKWTLASFGGCRSICSGFFTESTGVRFLHLIRMRWLKSWTSTW